MAGGGSFTSDQTTLQTATVSATVLRGARTRVTSLQGRGEAGSVLLLHDVDDAADETTLTYTPVNAATNIFTLGCYLYFTCNENGTWQFAHDLAKYTTATAGTFAWS